MSRIRKTIPLIVLFAVVSGASCSSLQEKKELTARDVFDRMEQRLLREDRVGFTVQSRGAFESSFEGWISNEGGELAIVAEGLWADDSVTVSAETSRDLLVLNTPNRMMRVEREPFLATAVLIGLSRMGVLHNLARLVAGKAPDGADGSVRDWVEARNIAFAGDGPDAIRFDIFVSDTRSGYATIEVDPKTGLPVRREQTVEFPSGAMTVVETYRYE